MATTIWIAAIIIFGVAEAATAGLTSIWFVLGGVAGLIAAVCGGACAWLQVGLFFAVSIAALAFTRPLVVKLMKKAIKPTNADRVLNNVGRVTERIDNALPSGAVYIDGKTWTARSADGEVIEPDAAVRHPADGGREAHRTEGAVICRMFWADWPPYCWAWSPASFTSSTSILRQ